MKKIVVVLLSIISFQSQAFGQLGFVGLNVLNGAGGGFSTGSSYTDKAWVEQQTTLTGGESVNLNVGGATKVIGAVIANSDISYDEDGKITLGEDKENLILKTQSFEYEDIEDLDVSEGKGFGINTNG